MFTSGISMPSFKTSTAVTALISPEVNDRSTCRRSTLSSIERFAAGTPLETSFAANDSAWLFDGENTAILGFVVLSTTDNNWSITASSL